MKLGKLLLGAGVVTSALTISAGFGIQSASAEDAQAAETKTTAIGVKDITISYEGQSITVKEDGSDNTAKQDSKLYVGIGSYSAKAPTDVKVKKWIEYDYDKNDGVTIDTSSLAVTKVQYVVIKGDVNTDEVAIQLAATPSKLAASVDYTDPADPQLKLNDVTKGKASAVAVSDVEFATANGTSFGDYKATTTETKDNAGQQETTVTKGTDLTKYQKFGATLKVRKAASEDVAGIDTTKDTGNSSTVSIKVNGNDVTAYAPTGTFASKELKVKVAKLAAGPKISVNYTKNTVSLPKTAEYRLGVGAFSTDLVKDTTKTVVVPISSFKMTGAFTLDVRTAAKANTKDLTKSKSASNITEVAVPAITTITSKVAQETGDSTDMDKDSFASADLEKVTFNGKVTFKYGEKDGQATVTSADSENAYEVYVTNDSTVGYITTTPTGGDATTNFVAPASTVAGAKKLAAGKRITLKNLKEGDKIFIRVSGNAKKKTFASEYSAFGTVKFPVAATATPAPTETTSPVA